MLSRYVLLAAGAVAASLAQSATAGQGLHGAPFQAEIYSTFDFSPERRAEYPEWELAHRCGGSLIAPNWVLTAAHCVKHDDLQKGRRIRLGTLDLATKPGATYRIDRVVRHAEYDPKTKINDIALVHFVADGRTDVSKAGRIAPIRLYGTKENRPVGAGTTVTVTGWGKTETGRLSPTLLQVDLGTVECASAAGFSERTTESEICAMADGKDACQGDSGGPMILAEDRPVLVGIVSWGDECAVAGKPGVYTRIDRANYLDWIRRATGTNPSGGNAR